MLLLDPKTRAHAPCFKLAAEAPRPPGHRSPWSRRSRPLRISRSSRPESRPSPATVGRSRVRVDPGSRSRMVVRGFEVRDGTGRRSTGAFGCRRVRPMSDADGATCPSLIGLRSVVESTLTHVCRRWCSQKLFTHTSAGRVNSLL